MRNEICCEKEEETERETERARKRERERGKIFSCKLKGGRAIASFLFYGNKYFAKWPFFLSTFIHSKNGH